LPALGLAWTAWEAEIRLDEAKSCATNNLKKRGFDAEATPGAHRKVCSPASGKRGKREEPTQLTLKTIAIFVPNGANSVSAADAGYLRALEYAD